MKLSLVLFMSLLSLADAGNPNKDVPSINNLNGEEGNGDSTHTNNDIAADVSVSGVWGNQGKGNDFNVGNAGKGNAEGDPHFRTYDGTPYSFHGECDLVMARSPKFGDNRGLDLHIRTTSMGSWSLISNAALRISDDIFEFDNNGSYFVNGSPVELPFDLAGKYSITKKTVLLTKERENGEVEGFERHSVNIDLGNEDNIRMTLFKGMIGVRLNASVESTAGMLGTHGIIGMAARDGTVLNDADEMGAEWQVRDTEPMLFREMRFPQYPDTCIPPATPARRRLQRQTGEELAKAVEACAKVDDQSRSFCIEDVLLTGDADAAENYLFGEAF